MKALTQIPAQPVQTGNTFFVDGAYGDDTTAQESKASLPYATIQAAIDASADGDVIEVAPGDYTGDTVSIPAGETRYINGIGAYGFADPDLNDTGVLLGRLGQIEYHANGCILYSDESETQNWANFLSAVATGETNIDAPTENWSISIMHMTLDTGFDDNAAGFDFDANAARQRMGIAGLGTQKPIFDFGVSQGFYNVEGASIRNVEVKKEEDISQAVAWKTTGNITGVCEDLISNGTFNFNTSGTANTFVRNITSTQRDVRMAGTGAYTGFRATGVNAEANEISIGASGSTFNGNVSFGSCDTLRLSGTINGSVSGESVAGAIRAGDCIINGAVSVKVVDDFALSNTSELTGKIRFEAVGDVNDADDSVATFGNGFQLIGADVSDSEVRLLGNAGNGYIPTYVNSDSNFRNCVIGSEGAPDDTTQTVPYILSSYCLNQGRFERCSFIGPGTNNLWRQGLPVDDGAVISNCVFNGFVSDPDKCFPIVGRSVGYYQGAQAYDATANQLYIELRAQPYQVSGGVRSTVASGTTFQVYLTKLGTSLTGAEGLEVEVETVELGSDVTVGTETFTAGTWVVRSTATDAAAIDAGLGTPGSDINSVDDANIVMVNKVVTISLIDTDLGGSRLAPEIRLTNPDTVTVTSTSYEVRASDRIILVDDDTAGGAVTLNFPAAANFGEPKIVKKLGTTGNVNSNTNVDGSTTLLSAQYATAEVVSDGAALHNLRA